MREQSTKWADFKTDFKTLVTELSKTETFDSEAICSTIIAYREKFAELPIKGKLYVVVNKRLLSGQLTSIIRDMEYEEAIKNAPSKCGCKTRERYGKSPKSEYLVELGIINDSYYMPKLYYCKNCEFKWTSYISDDSIGGTIFEKYNPEDESLIEYHR